MLIRIPAVLIVATSLAAPAVAQEPLRKPTCNAAAISQLEEKLTEMKDGRQKTTATSEVASARERLGQGQLDECQDHLLKATVQMK